MDNSSITYRLNSSFHSHPIHGSIKSNDDKSSSLNRLTNTAIGYKDEDNRSCFCFESDDESTDICLKSSKRKFSHGCLSNIVISTILIAYTFVGAIIFLAIEGDTGLFAVSNVNQLSNNPSGQQNAGSLNNINTTASTRLAKLGEESRTRTVENIWDITVSLNILYRENWTRLAAQEITRFQEQLIQHLKEEMLTTSYSPNSDTPHGKNINPESHGKIEWNLAKSFLYSLTVLTTIGKQN